MSEKYYIGLDVGTDSCGWAVTDLEYNIKRFKGNGMWGVRRFDGSQTAEERRSFRTARRRLDRRRMRLDWLEEIFAAEIGKVDPTFFIRLSESNLHIEDKSTGDKYALFSGEYTDKDFHKVIVFFDLPVTTAAERRQYTKFRKFLIRSGFMMLQESVYAKLALNQNAAAEMIGSVRKNKPAIGLVQILSVTEKQFSRMEVVIGETKSDVIATDERVVVL